MSKSSGVSGGQQEFITVEGAFEHNLKDLSLKIPRGRITVVTGVSGSGKSSLAFDTVLAESQRRFFYTLSHYSRQFLDLGSRPAVRKVSGLSPAIALAQNETQPSRRATVGTLTDLSELFAVMMARFGSKNCPQHGMPTSAQGVDGIVDRIVHECDGQLVAICVPVATSKKGIFRAPLTAFAEKGYLRAYIDGEMVSLSPVPELAREEKHTIKLIVDQVKVKSTARERLQRSISVALSEGGGFAEFFAVAPSGLLKLESGGPISTKGGCPVCGFSWPKLDARYFSANSLGRCVSCNGFGVVPASGKRSDLSGLLDSTMIGGESGADDEMDEVNFAHAVVDCEGCAATGVDAQYAAIKLGAHSIQQIMRAPLRDLPQILAGLRAGPLGANPAFTRVDQEVAAIVDRIIGIGLGYLHLARRVRSLSGGESQRLKLAGILSDSLRGVLYVLDEPSQGLHPAELDLLWAGLERLRDQGNTILIVDHDEALMRRADLVVDLGPGGGADGGRLLAQFAPKDAARFARESRTAWHLSAGAAKSKFAVPAVRGPASYIQISGCTLHNLDIKRVRFVKSALNVVSGVSGAGKSSLVLGTLHRNIEASIEAWNSGSRGKKFQLRGCASLDGIEDIEQLHLIDRRPVAKSSVSMPASYLDVFGELRDLYAQLPDAQIAGLTARSFSLNAEGGRCEECRGRGEVSLSMRFLSDARVPCPVCEGRRYQPPVLAVVYNGINIAQSLDLTIDQALETFANHKMIVRRLQPAQELGLGYLKMGQPSASLSGGEAQRLKMVPFLTKRMAAGTVLVMDEPTTGLHFDDVARLLERLKHLVALGATVIVVEHNTDMIRAADWLVDLGPGSAEAGGKLVYEGPPSGVTGVRASLTGQHLI